MKVCHTVAFLCVVLAGLAHAGPGAARDGFVCEMRLAGPEGWRALAQGSPASGQKKLLYYRVAYHETRGEPSAPVSEEEAGSDLQTVADYFSRVSRGLLRLEWAITPLLVLPHPVTYYESAEGPHQILNDARAAALAAGFDHLEYDLDLIRVRTLAGSEAGGLGIIGGRGAWVERSGPGIVAHELGHNFGFYHANFWDTRTPDPASLRFYPAGTREEAIARHPRHPAGLIGQESIIGPGSNSEYGDPFDLMGGGGMSDLNAIYQCHAGWITGEQTASVSGSRTLRLHAFDVPALVSNRVYAIRIENWTLTGRTAQQYWVQYRSQARAGTSASAGVLLHWAGRDRTSGPLLLLDAEPGGADKQGDPILKLGRTFSDPVLDLHITPVAQGDSDGMPWIDVEIQQGPFPSNRPPVMTQPVPDRGVAPGEEVLLEADGEDPDGDALSYHWDFGDGTHGSGPAVLKAWPEAGEYVARVAVSDRKGGHASASAVIRAGAPPTFRISGRVTDRAGKPVAGARVNNGVYSRNPGSANYRFAITDSDGRYTLTGLTPELYTNTVFHLLHRSDPAAAPGPVAIIDRSLDHVDFIADPLPRVTAALPQTRAREGMSLPLELTRTGETEEALSVRLSLEGGTANGADAILEGPAITARGLVSNGDYIVVFPAGQSKVTATLNVLNDLACEPEEQLAISFPWASEITRVIDGRPVSVPVPGWELAMVGGTAMWVQSQAPYVPGSRILLRIDEPEDTRPALSLTAAAVAAERPLQTAEFVVTAQGCLRQDLTVPYQISGTAMNGVDYELLSGTVLLRASEGAGAILIVPIPDDFDEGEETVEITLLPGEGWHLGEANAGIVLRDSAVLPDRLSAELGSGGRITIWTTGQAGRRHVLESSANLHDWTPIRTNLFFVDRASHVIEAPPGGARQFFRSRMEIPGAPELTSP